MHQSNTSVVLATYNGDRFLAEQLRSLERQTVAPLELIVGDDGSSDRTLEILDTFGRTSSFPVRIEINSPTLGFKRNFLWASTRSKGQYVAFCDQDDIWAPSKLELVQNAFTNQAVLAVAHKARLIDESGSPIGVHDQGITESRLIPPFEKEFWPVYYGFSLTARKGVVESIVDHLRTGQCGIRSTYCAHDGWVTAAAANLGSIFEIDEYLVDYRQHERNVVGKRPDRERFSTAREAENDVIFGGLTEELLAYFASAADRHSSGSIRLRAARAAEIYRQILVHIKARHSLHTASSIPVAMKLMVEGLVFGRYRSPYSGRTMWRKAAHDLLFIPRRHILGQ
jgi:glycosyltransferase involved in cell wall biosynthesis